MESCWETSATLKTFSNETGMKKEKKTGQFWVGMSSHREWGSYATTSL